MSEVDLLVDGFGRIRETVHAVLGGLTQEDLEFRADSQANSISWLIWHLTRIQDDHIAAAGDLEQVWFTGWGELFALPFDRRDTGYGHDSEQVAAVRVPADSLAGYHDATYQQTISFVQGLTESDLDKIVDRRWDPPVTMAVRLVSVLNDDMQHVGQAAFIRGIIDRS